MRTLQQTTSGFNTARYKAGAAMQLCVGTKLCSKALMLLLSVFIICAILQAVQISALLADTALVREDVTKLHAEQELLSGKYSSYFSKYETKGTT